MDNENVQVSMMESTHLAVECMSIARGGGGGVVINVASMGGEPLPQTSL